MADDKLDVLLRTTDNTTMSLEQSKKFNNTKRKINGICKALSLNTQKYDPQKTVENISAYITSTNKLDRILYSEISNYVYSLEMSERGIFATNLEKLLLYSLNDNNEVSEDCKKMIVKIYDHFQLALHQIENVNNIFANSIEEAKTEYDGHRFRSRLEARWAVFFNAVGLTYEYEIEGFEMDGTRYLPDFYIPSLNRWFEIKGKPLSLDEIKKCEEFCRRLDNENIKYSVLIGSPNLCAIRIGEFFGILEYVWEWPSEKYPDNYRIQAPKELIEDEYYSRFVKGLWVVPDKTEEEVAVAAIAAGKARFEFGEKPDV